MEKSLLIAGFGGQGVMLIGKELGYAAAGMGLYASFFPAYGAEQRGGTANCTLITSEEPIDCPICQTYDYMIIMNELSYARFARFLKPDGVMMVNSSLVSSRPPENVRCIEIDSAEAANRVGNPRAANMVVLGAYLQLFGGYDVEKVKEHLHESLARKPELLEVNLKGIDAGMAAVAAMGK